MSMWHVQARDVHTLRYHGCYEKGGGNLGPWNILMMRDYIHMLHTVTWESHEEWGALITLTVFSLQESGGILNSQIFFVFLLNIR